MATGNWSTKTLSALRRFDAYPKPLEDFRIKVKIYFFMIRSIYNFDAD